MANKLLTREEWMKSLDKLIDETATQSLIEEAVLTEREACAKIVEADGLARGNEGLVLIKAAERIRARSKK